MIQTVCEEHDYINAEVYFCADGTKTWKQCKNCGLLEPLPVIKQESETDVWDSFLLEYTKLLINKNDWEANRKLLMKSFSITRKNQ